VFTRLHETYLKTRFGDMYTFPDDDKRFPIFNLMNCADATDGTSASAAVVGEC
jgi:hypothetical protein